ncbi:membrane protein [Skermanella stibiiresistens SB22]|uniref:Membrane protein n=1 Tax=Skermanella stibiiresistens SB22 TaxID=1385369 RepID=W9H6C4_9PROT|nr:DUF1097 domain-containing protein [Skermanella stibiiresistens]EWY41594.1 membrane protein [Skermanella stibiiresistens SB22]
MPPRTAAMISLGVLGAIDTYLTATLLPVPVWVTFIAWASFFACGGGTQGFVKSVASNFTGIAIASLTLLAIHVGPAAPLFAAICVGLGTSAMIAATAVPLLSFPPAIVFGFASTVGTMAATGTSMATSGVGHPTLVAAVAMLVGACFGFVSEKGTALLTGGTNATRSAAV